MFCKIYRREALKLKLESVLMKQTTKELLGPDEQHKTNEYSLVRYKFDFYWFEFLDNLYLNNFTGAAEDDVSSYTMGLHNHRYCKIKPLNFRQRKFVTG